ncbi:MAG: TonB-dependent receptor [Gammaproteobacteria bacterium]|nr:TonB-dependent receptor [Gammaproteobacteria bacterium]
MPIRRRLVVWSSLGFFWLVASSGHAQSDLKLEEVIVTAEKRDASLQETSQAVTVMSGAELDQYSVSSMVDLNTLVPGLNVVKNEGTQLVMSMRGVGNEANQNVIASPAVSYHVDGVYMASPHVMQAKLLDIERLEVIRGPQGTLFGQNSTGGAINVVTTQPSFEANKGIVGIELGSYDRLRARGIYNAPLFRNAALRLSIATDYHAGFSKNVTLDQELDDGSNVALRGRLYIEPSELLSMDIVLQIASNDRDGPAQKGILDPTPDPRELAQDFPQIWELEATFASATIEYELDDYVFKSVSSIQDDTLDLKRDNDRHDLNTLPPFTILPAAYDPWHNNQRTLTQEFLLTSTTPLLDAIDWIAGYFYFQTDVAIVLEEFIDFGADGVFDPFTVEEVRAFALGDYGFITDADRQRRAHSVFFEGNYNVDERTRAIAGLRLSQDGVDSEISNFYGRSGVDTQSTSSRTLTGRFSFERDLSDLSMLYLSLVRGYKPAGSNLTFGRENEIAPIVVLPTYKKETVNTVEVGLKSDFLERRVRMNAAVFQYDYSNLQYQATDPEVFEGGVNNIPKSQITGAEFEMIALLTDHLDVDLRISKLDTSITSHHRSLDNVASDAATNALLAQGFALFGPEIQRARAENIVDVFGNELAKSPRSTVSLGINYERALFDIGQLFASVQMNQRGAYQYRIFNNPATDFVPAYTTINAILRFEPLDKDWHVTLRVINASNTDGVNARFTDVFGVGASSEELIPPRQFLVGVGLSF